MDTIAKFPSKAIASIFMPTVEAFKPLLLANKSEILSVPSTTYTYGQHKRQQLDVYEECTNSPSSPIILFFYGGGLNRGDKIMPLVPSSLVYHNFGAFFAKRGFTMIVADYRRVTDVALGTGEDAVFPSGGEDVRAVLDWLESTYLPSCGDKAQKKRDVFLMGNSAGGVHVSTYLLDARFENRRYALRQSQLCSLRGAALISVPFDFKAATPDRSEILQTYYPPHLSGTQQESSHDLFCPNGLLRALKTRKESMGTLEIARNGMPDILVTLGEFDPEDEIVETNDRFFSLWDDCFGSGQGIELKRMGGHNHISPPFSLMCGDKKAEEWAENVVEWMKNLQN
ncbi:hypothetical protein VE01_09042 [Pseudogymnoascus verrucosus]|uniref:BD-FAE-like domain-containing protein n=1 Tax=Pseudogymnoascus verrucosus TaxID=342668 RepID=A0A1B8GAL3_9PEZI|nr:uncharacterized protein VE01_09042 [Pseudogymnoascus verrucosus]OBT92817.1 hypothetical protein VE01_09042 [Pseudogymnoascus verrucosus]